MKRFAVLTSSGDAAGMNAAIRAVVRTGLDNGAGCLKMKEYGVLVGLLNGEVNLVHWQK